MPRLSPRFSLREIPAHHGPFPFWFWNGTMREDEIRRQLGLMREAGITEFIIHGRYGLKTGYLSAEWFDAVGAAVEEAGRTGMKAWIYDELNWPSGSAGGKVTADRSLCEHYLDSGDRLTLTKTAVDASPDFLSARATKKFIDLTHREYEKRFKRHFGGTIPGFFNDEVRFANARPWSGSLPKRIPQGAGYFRATARAIRDNYFKPLNRWCSSRGLNLIGHVMGEETIASNVRYMSDIFACLEQFHQPGIDHLGTGAEGFHHRTAATVGRLFRRPVTCETGGGLPWNFTPADLYRICGWLYANGVTRVILHGFFYENNPTDWPPDMFFRWKGWPEMKRFNEWASRIQYFLSRAVPVRRVSLHYPLEEFGKDFSPDPAFTLNFGDKGPVVAAGNALRLHLRLQELSSELYRRNIDFDLVPSRWLSRVKDTVLIVPGNDVPRFAGRIVRQDDKSARQTIDEVSALLGDSAAFQAGGAEPAGQPTRDTISDPYVHSGPDAAGVLLREFRLADSPAWLVWNANSSRFRGDLRLGTDGPWAVLDPSRPDASDDRPGPVLSLDLEAFSCRIVVPAGPREKVLSAEKS